MSSLYKDLKQECYEANMQLNALNLVVYTFGNVSAVDRKNGVFAIKPSGVDYSRLTEADIVVIDMRVNQDSGSPAVHDVPPEDIDVRHRRSKRGPGFYFGEDKTDAAGGNAGRMISRLDIIGGNSTGRCYRLDRNLIADRQ